MLPMKPDRKIAGREAEPEIILPQVKAQPKEALGGANAMLREDQLAQGI